MRYCWFGVLLIRLDAGKFRYTYLLLIVVLWFIFLFVSPRSISRSLSLSFATLVCIHVGLLFYNYIVLLHVSLSGLSFFLYHIYLHRLSFNHLFRLFPVSSTSLFHCLGTFIFVSSGL